MRSIQPAGNVKKVANVEDAYDVAVFVDVEASLRSGAGGGSFAMKMSKFNSTIMIVLAAPFLAVMMVTMNVGIF